MSVTFEPKGFRDVYWCGRLNEPVIISYTLPDKNPKCELCSHVYLSMKEFESDAHEFICHIVKPGRIG